MTHNENQTRHGEVALAQRRDSATGAVLQLRQDLDNGALRVTYARDLDAALAADWETVDPVIDLPDLTKDWQRALQVAHHWLWDHSDALFVSATTEVDQ